MNIKLMMLLIIIVLISGCGKIKNFGSNTAIGSNITIFCVLNNQRGPNKKEITIFDRAVIMDGDSSQGITGGCGNLVYNDYKKQNSIKKIQTKLTNIGIDKKGIHYVIAQ